MAFDGTTIANLVSDFNTCILNGRISKIAQPEKDELLLTIKGSNGQYRLILSANASLPLVYFTPENKQSPMTAPNFCMLLRKYIANGRITKIYQPEFERIINFEIEHLNELGDPARKTLVVEIMGKHSNIIFLDEKGMIIDSIKHISAQTSSVREVLPGRNYFIPKTQQKTNPLETNEDEFQRKVFAAAMPLGKAIASSYTGISTLISSEICHRAGVDSDGFGEALSADGKHHLYHIFSMMMDDIRAGRFSPCMVLDHGKPIEYAGVELTQFSDYALQRYDNISEILDKFYAMKDVYTRIRQKSVDLRKIVSTALERNIKKYDLQKKQLADTENREKFKVYGELIHTYGYGVEDGAKSMEALNYYTNETITIPLDPQLSAPENAQKYFAKYNKQKRTYEALSQLILETQSEIAHLESVSNALDIAVTEDDLAQIKEELTLSGYIRRKNGQKNVRFKSIPFHYLSSDGFHMYVGKNNLQNDELTFKFANGGDWWFHAKGIPGSHVIVRTEGQELPDRVFEEAGKLAAFYSKARDNDKVEVDYLQRRDVKKPSGSKPGFVVYYTNYSLTITPDISALTLLEG